jgi:flagellar hook-associated protein 3 FlgL
MVDRIATSFQNQNTLRGLRQSEADLALSTYQISSGNKARTLADVPTDANRILTLREVQARNVVYTSGMTSASNSLKATEAALQSMTDLLEDAAQTATLGRNENSAATRASLAPKAKSLADTFYNVLNTQFQGRYLFSGQNGLERPVNGVAAPATFPGSPLPTAWYTGDSSLPAVVTGPGTTQTYGVTGDDPALVKMKAGLEALWNGLQTNNLTDIDNAITVLKEARTDVSSALGRVGGELNTFTLLGERSTQQREFLTEQLNDLEKVDVAEAITTFSQQQATLEASMSIIAQINQLSLLNFLR